ncbi:hypothetical protein SGQ44_08200 [Flavobacterium sp. Fl-77]|uniref:Uncharacterized protein n=1 Tax=Flavobacterium flavipigmentatum TaxID=2893884 RepID=A0AAJ2SAW1_9FLAO|nr:MULTISPECIES: hypothetical protein [unclassified Flavobacterium]MDX6182353.1 hypothetical protein [Flavobacterium sp. Fl-33]MDX6185734.1 hypothetical protein [Flavobacterium sp. Fl-77]UFH38916.1 hypothetical protein LNP22_01250 [Flavobacterium sp. F-70]
MKKLWCWRCKTEVPMLNEEEFAVATKLYRTGFATGTCNMTREERFKDVLDYYFELTGVRPTECNSIMHHRIKQYGPPCENCSKPYRTPKASFCAACGHKRPIKIPKTLYNTPQIKQKWWKKLKILNRAG